MTVPANPYRCPPGPYERASLIAYYLKAAKPRAKLLILDAKDRFSKQSLFEAAWAELYPGLLEWVPLSAGGNVVAVDAKTRTLVTEFGEHRADVANVIPPQRAGALALTVGVADQTGWCPIDPVTFESRLVPSIHVVGDAAIAGAMPKSAFSANAQAKVCAAAVLALLRGETPQEPRLINTCYSLVAPDYGISIAGVYRPADGLLTEIEGAGGTSPKMRLTRSVPRKRPMPKHGSRRSRRKFSLDAATWLLALLRLANQWCRRRARAISGRRRPIPDPLTGTQEARKRVARSSSIVASACACSAIPAPFQRSHSRASSHPTSPVSATDCPKASCAYGSSTVGASTRKTIISSCHLSTTWCGSGQHGRGSPCCRPSGSRTSWHSS